MKCKGMHKFTLLFLVLSVPVLINSCATPSPCPDNPAPGNAGNKINTGNNDYLPVWDGNTLYFTSVREDNNGHERIYKTEYRDGEFQPPVRDESLPLNQYPYSISPSFYNDKATGEKEMFFAAISPGSKANRDIYYSKWDGKEWSKPVLVNTGISSGYYESHPAIAPDGSFLVFSSDRPGGIGETDLYISRRDGENKWTKPENLGDLINTPYEEISPCIAPDGSLYFASKGYSKASGYDIIKAEKIEEGVWAEAKPLKFPINTVFDENGPAINDHLLLFSSDREGGCGAYDIYAFNLCGPVFVEGHIYGKGASVPVGGVVRLYDSGDSLLNEVTVSDDGLFRFPLKADENYVLKYSNECMPDFAFERKFYAPCSDSSTVKMVVNFGVKNELNQFTFEQYKIPFFVSGYYQPNTSENLSSLKMQFDYRLLGIADSTRYIENPDDKYDKYTSEVEKAMNDAKEFILSKFALLKGNCIKGDEKLTIKITGYADPRPFSETAKYSGPDIDDSEIGFKVNRGDRMTNELLSKLRAYFTAKLFQQSLEKNKNYMEYRDRIVWKVSGSGIDERDDVADNLKRRVNIEIGLK